MAVRIVTDSTSDLPREFVEELDIKIVPLNVHFGEETFLDWVELKPEDFFAKLRQSDIMPRTSQPSPGDFVTAYKEVAGTGDSIISIHISDKLSGTCQSAYMARDMLKDYDIEVINSKITAMALGYVVIEAARAAKAGKSKEEILEIINKNLEVMHIFFLVDTLEYLQKNGRIGKASAFLGGMLNVKPILSLNDGVVVPVEKVRGKTRARKRLVELLKERIPAGKAIKGTIVHGDALEEAEELAEALKEEFEIKELIITMIGSIIGSHTGPGLLGLLIASAD
ncbi:MAG TPA: DegV family protein [Firmicutes bacterium]|nr:DegV family protein [Bacillota bacterium]